jgi:hypothetical protein
MPPFDFYVGGASAAGGARGGAGTASAGACFFPTLMFADAATSFPVRLAGILRAVEHPPP